ncbi:SRPBCC family protein [Seonamhaeicola maritimus]|uniref:SRPBCC family protein n=1 Tax=Seonamhaeicola maritimus TaxID=2591822 RepID=UPI0024949D58|nr:SRPBCC family protein [Seonamhaeicola maritimus]
MTEVVVSKQIKVEAVNAWSKLASFRGIEEISPIEKSITEGEGAGATRTCYLPDGAAIHEVLNKVDNNTMEMEYKITEGPFPVEGYVSTIKVEGVDKSSCKVTWGCEFETLSENEQAMSELFGGFYNVIIDSLESALQN